MSARRRRRHQLPHILAKALTQTAQQRKATPTWRPLYLLTVTVAMLLLLLDLQQTLVQATPIEIVLNTTRNSQHVDAGTNKWLSPGYFPSYNNSTTKRKDRQEDNAIEQLSSASTTSAKGSALSTNLHYKNTTNVGSHTADMLPLVLVPQQTTAATPPLQMLNGHNSNNNKREKPLKCHCDVCKDNNYICETDGYCFTSVVKEEGKINFSYRCLEKKYDLQREPLECLTSREKQNVYRVKCCSDDFCNKDELLKLSFGTGTTRGYIT
ncbi:uncharacterized protein [Eurosta solidaginis]|uniref:uncharacterized protein isoform X2 n=1 Tax=Eurosta solidaginis TaxID=178769 RepID=UPI003530F01A